MLSCWPLPEVIEAKPLHLFHPVWGVGDVEMGE